MIQLKVLLTLCVLLFSHNANAQWQEEIEHLGIILPYPLEKSEKEINIVAMFRSFNNTDGKSNDFSTRVEFDYGLSYRTLVGIDFSYQRRNTFNSSQIEVEGKYLYLSNQWIAASIGTAIGYGDNEAFIELFFPVSHAFSDHVRSHLNFVSEWTADGNREHSFQGAIEYQPLNTALALQALLNFELEENDPAGFSLVAGFLVPFRDFALGVGVPIGISNAQSWGISVNFEIELEDK